MKGTTNPVPYEEVAVIGAGPYGLSVSAFLQRWGVPTRTFGKTMEFWDRMPLGMHLKSVWSASSVADPDGAYTLDRYAKATGYRQRDPIPLRQFVEYGRWFQQSAVPDIDATYVRSLSRDGTHFRLDLVDGRSLSVDRVVVAVGIDAFAYLPAFAQDLPSSLVTHTQNHYEFSRFSGQRIVVLGRGQSAVQTAAFLHEAGADVELIARGPISWINRKLYDQTGPARHIFYPPSDVGPPGLNWLIHFPRLYRHLPETTRMRVEQRALRPSGAKWLRHRVEGVVRITAGVEVTCARPCGDQLELALSDGTMRLVDHLIAGTGYQPHLDRLAFIDPALRATMHISGGFPRLNQWYESSIEGLYFVGALASYSLGPLCRFVAGTRPAAQQIAHHVVGASAPRSILVPARKHALLPQVTPHREVHP